MLIWNIMLAIVWAMLTSTFTPVNMISGFVLGYICLWLLSVRGVLEHTGYIRRVRQVAGFTVFFIKELFLANMRMAGDALRPGTHVKPGIIAVPLDAKTEVEITILANLISLTPGSLSIDISTDRKVLFIHVMYIDRWDVHKVVKNIKKGFEKRIIEMLR